MRKLAKQAKREFREEKVQVCKEVDEEWAQEWEEAGKRAREELRKNGKIV